MDFTNPMHPMNPVNPNPAFARHNPANVWHNAYAGTEQPEPEAESAAPEYDRGDAPFFACFCVGVFLVLAFSIVCVILNWKHGGER